MKKFSKEAAKDDDDDDDEEEVLKEMRARRMEVRSWCGFTALQMSPVGRPY